MNSKNSKINELNFPDARRLAILAVFVLFEFLPLAILSR
jgi:hypothetical protein